MKLTLTGHAGLHVSSGDASLLCDPWFTPAYLASWFPFPDNAGIDLEPICSPTYLYISHLHKDHFDPAFLARHVDKSATVLLPEFPLHELRAALEDLGFTRFVQTREGRPVELDGFRVVIATATTPSDGPLGDSAIAVDDGEVRILNQNDCRPRDLDALRALAPFDVHLLQYSGAIWYPMVYRLDPQEMDALGRDKRAKQMDRAVRYIEAIGARHVVPFAGPPAFLDDALFGLNNFDDDPANIFLDQPAFLRHLEGRGVTNAHLAISGTAIEVGPSRFEVSHPGGADEVRAIYDDKRSYLAAYRERRRAELQEVADLAAPGADGRDLVAELAGWWEPLLGSAPTVRQRLGGPLVLEMGDQAAVLDPPSGTVRSWDGRQPWEHWFAVDPGLVRAMIDGRVADWVNELFLSCRFEAARRGDYNETVFSFFKCLEPARMRYLEKVLSDPEPPDRMAGRDGDAELWRCGAFLVQRRCPHLGADLRRFGSLDGEVLTCTLHGRSFDLVTGRCLNAESEPLVTRPLEPEAADAPPA